MWSSHEVASHYGCHHWSSLYNLPLITRMTCHLSPVSLSLTVCVHLVRSKWLNRLVFIAALHLIVSRASISSGASTLNPPTRHKVFLSLALFYTSTHMEGSPSQTWEGCCSVKQMDHLTMDWKTKGHSSRLRSVKMASHHWGHNRNRTHKMFYTVTDLEGVFPCFLRGSSQRRSLFNCKYWPNYLSEVLCENAFKSSVAKQIHPYGKRCSTSSQPLEGSKERPAFLFIHLSPFDVEIKQAATSKDTSLPHTQGAYCLFSFFILFAKSLVVIKPKLVGVEVMMLALPFNKRVVHLSFTSTEFI